MTLPPAVPPVPATYQPRPGQRPWHFGWISVLVVLAAAMATGLAFVVGYLVITRLPM